MISARGLSRTFSTKTGTVEAVKSIDLEVSPREVVGLLGPNGAGKTTTMRMLTTLLAPSAGTALVAGVDLAANPREVRRRIGYVAQIGATPAAGTRVAEELVVQGRLQGMSKADAKARVDELLPQLDLEGMGPRALSELSGGQRRRFDIAVGLVHRPKLIFLDEPTTGLDPQSRANLWEHVRSLRTDFGVTVLITTHYLDEADALADRLMIMDRGTIVADDTPDALKAQVSGDVIILQSEGDVGRAEQIARRAISVRASQVHHGQLHLTVDRGETALVPLLRALDAEQEPLASVAVQRPTLDDVFLSLTGRSLRDDED